MTIAAARCRFLRQEKPGANQPRRIQRFGAVMTLVALPGSKA